MKKQYLEKGYVYGTALVEIYHDGVLQSRRKLSTYELDDHIDGLEMAGYEKAVTKTELQNAKMHYEWCLEHLLVNPNDVEETK